MRSKVLIFCLLLFLILCVPAFAGNTLTQFGFTWTFAYDVCDVNVADAYQYGQFANGDYWVVANAGDANDPNVIITLIDPASTDVDGRVKSGSMVNPLASQLDITPTAEQEQGYDNTFNGYAGSYKTNLNIARPGDANLSTANPAIVEPNSSIVSLKSVVGSDQNPQFSDGAVLTILPTAAAVNDFRPCYCGTDKTINFNVSDVNYDTLSNLAHVNDMPTLIQADPNEAQTTSIERMFQRPWIDYFGEGGGSVLRPSNNVPHYSKESSRQVSEAALMLNLTYTNAQKETLMVRFLQVGIDCWGVINTDGESHWRNNGGHSSARKWPILFAGIVFNDAGMKAIGDKSGDYLYSDANDAESPPTDYIHFGEDDQTFYVKAADIYSVPYTRYTYGGSVYWGHYNGPKGVKAVDYTDHHLNMAEYGINHTETPIRDNALWEESNYRTCCTAYVWDGFVLAAHIMGAKTLWNHDVLFDYQDRFISLQSGEPWQHSTTFTKNMWDAYRTDYGAVYSTSFDIDDPCEPIYTASYPSATSIRLAWGAPQDAVKYRVYRDAVMVQDNISDLYYLDTGLAETTTYTYVVFSIDGNDIQSTDFTETEYTTTGASVQYFLGGG